MATPAPKPTPKPTKPPVMTEGTGNPKDKRDWTNAPGTAAWARQLDAANNPKKAAIAKARKAATTVGPITLATTKPKK